MDMQVLAVTLGAARCLGTISGLKILPFYFYTSNLLAIWSLFYETQRPGGAAQCYTGRED